MSGPSTTSTASTASHQPPATSNPIRPCAVCGLHARLKCGRCKAVRYCGQSHQRAHWKSGHKLACSDMAALHQLSLVLNVHTAGIVFDYLPCARCLASRAGPCRVPHPAHMRQSLGGMFGGDESRNNYRCNGCDQSYSHVVRCSDKVERIEGAQWCFEGEHSVMQAPAAGDMRRVFPNTVALVANPCLQEQIDALPADVVILTIVSGGSYDSSLEFTLAHRLPALQELQLEDVCCARLALTEELTPQLRKLFLQNVPDECELELSLPNLREATIHYYGGDHQGTAVQRMLANAFQLERFDSYKLWVSDLHFASNRLHHLNIHRSDCMSRLTLWAPNLKTLGVQACYGLDDIVFLEGHPTLAASLPTNHVPPQLLVNATNAILGPRALQALYSHGAVVSGLEEDSDDGYY